MNPEIINRLQVIIGLTLLCLLLYGCGGSSPTIPGTDPLSPSGLSGQSETAPANRVLWGIWQFQVNLAQSTIDVIPLRECTAHVNIVKMLEPAPLKFLSIDNKTLKVNLAEKTIDVDVILTHPFPGQIQFTGFDVRGILISKGTLDGLSFDNSVIFPDINETRLTNADGYTRWWNPVEFTGKGLRGYNDGLLGKPNSTIHYTATVNGYKYFADGLLPNDEVFKPVVVQSRGRFSSSSVLKRHYSLAFGPTQSDFMVFNYAVDASWERPSSMPPHSIDDFPVSANCQEPFAIKVIEDINTLYYDPDLEDCPVSGGVLRLKIYAATWQGLNGISKVLIGSPDLDTDFFEATPIGGFDSFGAHISTYSAEIAPDYFENLSPMVIIAAESPYGSYTVGPENLNIQFAGPSDAKLTTYFIHQPTVGINSPPQVGPVDGPVTVTAGEENTYSVLSYYDCQDLMKNLEFSWEIGDDSPAMYDDGFGITDGQFKTGNGSIKIVFPDEGDYIVDVRVKDMDGLYGYTTQPLQVHANLPPAPVFPPTSINLTLTLKRTVFFSYEYGTDPGDLPGIQLAWNGSTVTGMIGEWAIYRDNNPYDGVENWQEVGQTPPNITTFTNLQSGDYGYDSGGAYYYRVKARSVAGNPKSDSIGSTQWAFIEFENAEITGVNQDKYPWSMGYGGAESAWFRQWERPGYGGAISGACYIMDPDSVYMRAHTWSVIASQELPILASPTLATTTQAWIIELVFGAQIIPMNEAWDSFARLSVGTVPNDPSTNNTQAFYLGYDEAPPADFIAGTAYNTYYATNTNTRFDDTSGTFNDRHGWGRDEYAYPLNFARFMLNDLNPAGKARRRAAIGFGSGTTTDTLARPRMDEIAVIIY